MRGLSGGSLLFFAGLFLAGCHAVTPARPMGSPYAASHYVRGVEWDFDATVRLAHGSDLWPCAWAADSNLYCAWGDGGGFDGDSDHVGRVSLGFARVSGRPAEDLVGKNVWGAPPYAESAASFGGKVGSMIEADGRLLASGRFWRAGDTDDAVHKSGAGPYASIAWSTDGAHSWTVDPHGGRDYVAAFLDRGPDRRDGAEPVYMYYFREGDDERLFLKRVPARAFAANAGLTFQYYAGRTMFGRARWLPDEAAAAAVFIDRHHVQGPSVTYMRALGRYLLTTGHYPGSDDNLTSSGKWGLFESTTPWGPWRTIAYYEDWAHLDAVTRGDYLGFRLPSKWEGAGGREIWGVYSGLGDYDSLNLIRGRLTVRP